MICQT